ncbi:MAG: dUTP diphosphatase [Patescibacteria group bacterium]|nr:dUTP diphosphatase [Patescibacteria group bacterium]
MNAKIKRFDKDLPLPERKTDGAAAFDLAAREAVTIQPGAVGYVPLNVAIETPPDHFLLIAARSSTHKKGIMMANGIGIIDPDYSGNEDEIKAAYYNFSAVPVVIEKGERVAQGMFIKISHPEWDETDDMPNRTRGGFGTTGGK